MPHDIFISYSQPDRECALELTQQVEDAGFRVWMAPRDVTPGADWAEQIIEALSAARIMVLVFSADTSNSPQVRREVERAVHKQLRIVPFRIEDVLPSKSLEYFLSTDHWLDAFPAPRQPHYARLCTHLKTLLGGAGATAATSAARVQPSAGAQVQAASAAGPAAATADGRAPSPAPGRQGALPQAASPGAPPAWASASAAQRGGASAAGPAAVPSVAVLPFANLSSDPEQEYFSDGLSEELIHQLANLNGLHVAGRTSSFSFKGKQEDLRVIGEKLGVAHVLEGSVRKAGNRLRITAQLISCADGYHLWSQTFDRTLDDIFAIQDDIGRTVAKALSVTLRLGQVLTIGGTQDVEAYDLYLRAQAHARLLGAAHLQQAATLYRAAVSIDPDFAPAWAGLASALQYASIFAPDTSDDARRARERELERALGRALELVPDLWSGHMANAWYKWRAPEGSRHEWLEAERAMQKTEALAPPSECGPRFYLAVLLGMAGRVEESIPLAESARAVDPLRIDIASGLQGYFAMTGREAEAEAEYRRSAGLDGDREALEETALLRAFDRGDSLALIQAQVRRYLSVPGSWMPLWKDLVDVLDRPEAVRARLRQAFEDPEYQDVTRQTKIALWAAQFGDAQLALAAARHAYVDGRGFNLSLIWSSAYRTVRKDPRFKDLLRDLGIVQYWRETGKWGDFARPVGAEEFDVW